MDFFLSEDDQDLKEMARDLAEKRILPRALEIDEEGELPRDLLDECAELGYFGFVVPEEYGGLGFGSVPFIGVLEEISGACASLGIMLSVHNSLTCEIINRFGSDELKKKYLPDMAAGKIGSYCITEPDAGTDITSMTSTAEDMDDHWLLNGTKIFVTSAKFAGVFIVFAKTDPEGGHKGISTFVVEAGSEGLTLGQPEKKCGIKASDTREVVLVDVKVPKENIIGEVGDGFKQCVTILNSGRIGVSAQAVGIAQAALNEAIKYSKERKQFGQAICNFQALQFKMADMATQIDAGRLMAYRAAQLKDLGKPVHRESSMAKLFCSTMANYVCTEAVQIHGGYGYIKEYAVERYFRDARVTELYEGTTEAQRLVISRDLLKE